MQTKTSRHKIEVLYPDTDYTNLTLGSLDVYSKDKDGDVEFTHDDFGDLRTFYLDQDQMKALIEHLQKQIK